MRKYVRFGMAAFAAVVFLAACGKQEEKAPETLDDAKAAYSKGDYELTIKITEKLKTSGATAADANFLRAEVHARQSQAETALDDLEAALAAGLATKSTVITESAFDSLRMHPRYLMLLERYEISAPNAAGADAESHDGVESTHIKVGDIEIDTSEASDK